MTDHTSERDRVGHTPGPWRLFTTPDGRKVIGVGDRDGGGITDQGDVSTNNQGLWRSGEEKLANARLIAAAPEMLEALKELTAVLGADTLDRDAVVPSYHKARAAIAKALSPSNGGSGE